MRRRARPDDRSANEGAYLLVLRGHLEAAGADGDVTAGRGAARGRGGGGLGETKVVARAAILFERTMGGVLMRRERVRLSVRSVATVWTTARI